MKKILNWLFGSFFRTIGRVFGFLAVVILLLLIGSKLGLKIPDFLMPMKISAATNNWAVNQSLICVDRQGSQTCTSFQNNPYDTSPTYPVELLKFRLKTGSGFKMDTTYTINLGYKPTPEAIHPKAIEFQFSNSETKETNFKCTEWRKNDAGYYRTICDFTPSTDVDNTPYLYIYVRFYEAYLDTIRPSLLSEYSYVEGVGSIIKDQTNQIIEEQEKTTNAVEDLNDTINNNDTSGAQDSAVGFFDDFQSDDFGLSSIVTAPLRGINAMLNDTCIAPSATYKGQLFSLPCGSMLWNRPGGQDFKNFINVMYGGLLAYLVIRKFFLDVENLKNPDSDKVEVDKL